MKILMRFGLTALVGMTFGASVIGFAKVSPPAFAWQSPYPSSNTSDKYGQLGLHMMSINWYGWSYGSTTIGSEKKYINFIPPNYTHKEQCYFVEWEGSGVGSSDLYYQTKNGDGWEANYGNTPNWWGVNNWGLSALGAITFGAGSSLDAGGGDCYWFQDSSQIQKGYIPTNSSAGCYTLGALPVQNYNNCY